GPVRGRRPPRRGATWPETTNGPRLRRGERGGDHHGEAEGRAHPQTLQALWPALAAVRRAHLPRLHAPGRARGHRGCGASRTGGDPMTITEHEAALVAARRMLLTGPFWLLDLWESLPPVVQDEVVETLATRESFRDAVEASGLTDTLDALARDE